MLVHAIGFPRRACCGFVHFFFLLAATGFARAGDETRSLKALLITGGCCHDYAYQAERLVAGSKAVANIDWTVEHDGRRGTRAKIDLYDRPWWAEDYDVVVHNECFADTDDPEYIRRITSVHHAGTPAVVIHCAMHTYRAAEIDDWREFLGVTSRRHEHQSEYAVALAARGHPVMARFPETWKSPRDELYVIEKVWPRAQILAVGRSERDGRTHAAFWTNLYGEARVFGTTFGHGNATFDDPVFIDTVTRGLLWAAGELTDAGEPGAGLAPPRRETDWARDVAASAAETEQVIELFNGEDLSGWTGADDLWSVEEGTIVGRNEATVPTSTYLFTEREYRTFRLLFEVKQTRSEKHSPMHSAVAVLGERFDDQGNAFGFKGPLVMFCNDWGIWDAHGRNRIEPAGHQGPFRPESVEREGDWNRIEVLVIGERIRCVANGKLVFDFTDDPAALRASPVGLQLHSNTRPQEFRFRGLVLTEEPGDRLLTLDGE